LISVQNEAITNDACECIQEFDLNYITCNITSLNENLQIIHQKTIETLSIQFINSSKIPNGLFQNLEVNFLTIRNYSQLAYQDYDYDFLVKNIDLSNNNLVTFEFNTFSKQLKKSIEYIQLNNNRFQQVPNLTGFLNLNELDFKLNKLQDINSTSIELFNLEILDISFNMFKIIEASNFTYKTSLQKLSVANNLIKQIKHLEFDNLIYLEISFNKLSTINETTFSSLVNLIELYLSNNLIDSIEMNSFNNLTKLSTLDLSFNQLSYLDSNLFKKSPQLQKLYVQNNNLKMFSFIHLNNLFILDLSNNKLTNIEVEVISNNLNILRLSNNKLRTLNNSLESFGKLQFLYLDNNFLNEIHSDISTITKLDYSNQNGNLGIIPNYFFKKLKTNQILLTLNLSLNLDLKFENKSFCYNNSKKEGYERSFLDLYLSNVTLFHLNKCFLKQLSFIFKRIRLFIIDLNNDEQFFCECNYRIFLSYFNILIKNKCPRFSSYCLDMEFNDDCKDKIEFKC